MKAIHLVDPCKVELLHEPSRRDIEHQKARLEAEGQIEPLVAIEELGVWWIDNKDWPFASAQVLAARELGWPTILVCEEETSG